MDALLSLAFLVFIFVGVPILLPRVIIKLTQTKTDGTTTEYTPPSAKEAMPANYAKNEQLVPAERPTAKDNKAGSSGFVVLVLAVPAIGIAIAGLGLCVLLLALMTSIATFGYSGFFDFAFATMKFGGVVFLIGIPIAVLGGIAFAIGKIFE